jgi:hypothetical protein
MENFESFGPDKTDREPDNSFCALLTADLVCLNGLLHLVGPWLEYF